jgi:serine/threonine-protein kinase SRPK3
MKYVNLYYPGGLHPVYIGDKFIDERYQVLYKLGFGNWSTVWLARDHFKACYVALKIYEAEEGRRHFGSDELAALCQLEITCSLGHPHRV